MLEGKLRVAVVDSAINPGSFDSCSEYRELSNRIEINHAQSLEQFEKKFGPVADYNLLLYHSGDMGSLDTLLDRMSKFDQDEGNKLIAGITHVGPSTYDTKKSGKENNLTIIRINSPEEVIKYIKLFFDLK